MQATQFAGTGCGQRYEKEFINKFRDCMTFYCDGRVLFQRFCCGEGACLVFEVWAALETDGALRYDQPLPPLARDVQLPAALTGAEGSTLYFDNARWKWQCSATLAADAKHGYSPLRMALRRLLGR